MFYGISDDDPLFNDTDTKPVPNHLTFQPNGQDDIYQDLTRRYHLRKYHQNRNRWGNFQRYNPLNNFITRTEVLESGLEIVYKGYLTPDFRAELNKDFPVTSDHLPMKIDGVSDEEYLNTNIQMTINKRTQRFTPEFKGYIVNVEGYELKKEDMFTLLPPEVREEPLPIVNDTFYDAPNNAMDDAMDEGEEDDDSYRIIPFQRRVGSDYSDRRNSETYELSETHGCPCPQLKRKRVKFDNRINCRLIDQHEGQVESEYISYLSSPFRYIQRWINYDDE